MINRSYQCDWSDLKKECCLYIINNPLMSTEHYCEMLDVNKKMIFDCYESLNMPLSKKPDECVGASVRRRKDPYSDITKNLRVFAASYGLKFKRCESGFAFFDSDNTKSVSMSIPDWKSLHSKNLIFEVLGI